MGPLTPDPNGLDALTESGRATLIAGGPDASAVLDALYDFWLDLRRGRRFEAGLVRLAWLRTAERLPAMAVDPPLRVMDAFDEAFGALAIRPAPPLVRDALVEGAIDLWRTSIPSRTRWLVHASTSIVGVWPEAVGPLFGAAFEDDGRADATLLYVSLVALPAEAHPLVDAPPPPWDRFGAEHGCRWDASSVDALTERFETARLRAWLTRYEARPDARWPSLAEEIRVLQLETDFPHRRAQLLRNLAAATPPSHWDL